MPDRFCLDEFYRIPNNNLLNYISYNQNYHLNDVIKILLPLYFDRLKPVIDYLLNGGKETRPKLFLITLRAIYDYKVSENGDFVANLREHSNPDVSQRSNLESFLSKVDINSLSTKSIASNDDKSKTVDKIAYSESLEKYKCLLKSNFKQDIISEFKNKILYLIVADCIEIIQGALVILDDIMDDSKIRRGKQCWHILEGLKVVHDAEMLISLIYLLLRFVYSHFKYIYLNKKNIIGDKKSDSQDDESTLISGLASNSPEMMEDFDFDYYKAIKKFNQTFLKTAMGQTQDALEKTVRKWDDAERFYTRENYEKICVAKNSFYTFALPIDLGFLLSNMFLTMNNNNNVFFDLNTCQKLKTKNYNSERNIGNDSLDSSANVYKLTTKTIDEFLLKHAKFYQFSFESKFLCFSLLLMGIYHQIKDDYLNFFPSISGKSETDLEERKLTFFTYQIVEKGFDQNVLDFLMMKTDESYVKGLILPLLKEFEENEINFVNDILKCKDGFFDVLVDICVAILYKRKN
ncbi:hypothetical protein EDEG_01060 [Edhazardia aedis USNM 41457]|uniref:Uncharacterized protein n=1 Tax=Edhazardia aedis (strain USNM 41457) TaxID=1003232 RepID=J9DQD6_EDHAE|nr:hypothetical protein EDEG_01060 [Edhazardia aedis USNM 41457]|eukprot:EJW04770.1 hypothetical protein EDEG_01060 [Edhazardia aedis USNM 41457]